MPTLRLVGISCSTPNEVSDEPYIDLVRSDSSRVDKHWSETGVVSGSGFVFPRTTDHPFTGQLTVELWEEDLGKNSSIDPDDRLGQPLVVSAVTGGVRLHRYSGGGFQGDYNLFYEVVA